MDIKPTTIKASNRIARIIWNIIWLTLARPTPAIMFRWRRLLIVCFGGELHPTARVYPTVKIWAPWNLRMDELSCLAPEVTCYNVEKITLRSQALVSQGSTLCTASHDYQSPAFPLIAAPIILEPQAWVTTECFVAPGVTMAEGSVLLARGVATKSCEPWLIYAGVPARAVKKRQRSH